ncbi:MAG TPA: helix-turn-helix domain-containing protein [Candidatus Faecousia intestinigallinarum]|nr:helix-turn-helix domain-containing protein [Candidatus Faecousia intestinigallinarum]
MAVLEKEEAAVSANTAAPQKIDGGNSSIELYQKIDEMSTANPNPPLDLRKEAVSAPGYYVVIPATVWLDDRLPPNAKILYGDISALANQEGYCFASNEYLSRNHQLTDRTISKLISTLAECGHIFVEITSGKDGKRTGRKIRLAVSLCGGQPLEENFQGGGRNLLGVVEEKFYHNNTSNNTGKEKESKKKKKCAPAEDFDPKPQFVAWLRDTYPAAPSHGKNAVYAAFVRFCEERAGAGTPLPSARAVTALCNKLQRYAGSDLRLMADLLDTATVNSWRSVYPERGIARPPQAEAKKERAEEWL